MLQKAMQGDIAENEGTGYKDGYKNLEGVGVGTRFVRAEGGGNSWENGDVIHVQGIGEEGNPIYGKLALGVTAMDVTAIKSMELGFRYGSVAGQAKSVLNEATFSKFSRGLALVNFAFAFADNQSNGGQLQSKIDMAVSVIEFVFPEVALIYGILDISTKAFTGKTISENIQEGYETHTIGLDAMYIAPGNPTQYILGDYDY